MGFFEKKLWVAQVGLARGIPLLEFCLVAVLGLVDCNYQAKTHGAFS